MSLPTRKMKRLYTPIQKSLIAGSSLAAGLTGLSSAAVTIAEDNVDQFQTEVISEFVTTGDDMDGMVFTVTYADTSTASAVWASTPTVGEGAAVSAGNFSLDLTGTTFENLWTLENLSELAITGFSFSGIEGRTIFDRTFGDVDGTLNSASGMDFEFGPTFEDWDADVTYAGPVRLEGAGAPVGDLFVDLEVLLTDETIAPSASLTFYQDTDNATFEISNVPEPSAGLAIGLLLSSAFMLRRRA